MYRQVVKSVYVVTLLRYAGDLWLADVPLQCCSNWLTWQTVTWNQGWTTLSSQMWHYWVSSYASEKSCDISCTERESSTVQTWMNLKLTFLTLEKFFLCLCGWFVGFILFSYPSVNSPIQFSVEPCEFLMTWQRKWGEGSSNWAQAGCLLCLCWLLLP